MKVTHSRGSVSELRLFTLWSNNKGQSAHTNTHRYAAPPSLTCRSCLLPRQTQWSHGRSRPGDCRSVRSTRCAPNPRLHLRSDLWLQTLRTQTTSPRTASCCPREWGRASPPPPWCRLKTPCGWEREDVNKTQGREKETIYTGRSRQTLFII